MPLHPLAGKPVPPEFWIDVQKLEQEYFRRQPDLSDPSQRVSFGTSGHRGTPATGTFTEAHILAITQAICEFRTLQKTDGPLFLGKDTHALSRAAENTALEVLAANAVPTYVDARDGFTPTPAVSHAILTWNRGPTQGLADGIVITPSHNPPEDGGFKYNPPNGGPADTDATDWIQKRANALLDDGGAGIKRMPIESARRAPTTTAFDFADRYVRDLGSVIDMEIIARRKVKLGVDPLGGASLAYWPLIRDRYGLDITIVNDALDPSFKFMSLDHDGRIRMDCSSPYAMAGLVRLKDQFDVAFGNDPDADRHGIVTRTSGLLNPNHYLAVAIQYLLKERPSWKKESVVGKTLVSSSIIDRVVAKAHRQLFEVPVGFKWFTPGLFDGSCCFGGEESAGASFLRKDGTAWSTDKDGILLCLLAAEITARTEKDPGQHYRELTAQFGESHYTRIDAPASAQEKAQLKKLAPASVSATQLAGEPILQKLSHAPGNNAAIGGLKVTSENGWFAARPSGTENIYKLYAESLRSADHLNAILVEAKAIVSQALSAS